MDLINLLLLFLYLDHHDRGLIRIHRVSVYVHVLIIPVLLLPLLVLRLKLNKPLLRRPNRAVRQPLPRVRCQRVNRIPLPTLHLRRAKRVDFTSLKIRLRLPIERHQLILFHELVHGLPLHLLTQDILLFNLGEHAFVKVAATGAGPSDGATLFVRSVHFLQIHPTFHVLGLVGTTTTTT